MNTNCIVWLISTVVYSSVFMLRPCSLLPWIRTTLYPIHVIHLFSKIGCPWSDPGTAISRQLILNTQVIMSIIFRLVTSDFALNSWRSEKCGQNLIFIHYYIFNVIIFKKIYLFTLERERQSTGEDRREAEAEGEWNLSELCTECGARCGAGSNDAEIRPEWNQESQA